MRSKKIILFISTLIVIISAILSKTFISKDIKTLRNELAQIEMSNFSNFFIENIDQYPDSIEFYINIKGGKVFILQNGALFYSLISKNSAEINFKEKIGCKTRLIISGEGQINTKVNYIKGNNPKKWVTNANCYQEIDFGEIEKGIRLTLKATKNTVEKIYTILPEANPGNIKIIFDSCKFSQINNDGELELTLNTGKASFTKPIAYQNIKGEKKYVEIEYAENAEYYSFKTGNYNNNYPLIIDPLINATYLGGSGMEQAYNVVQDNNNNIFVCGYTSSSDLPSTSETYQSEFNLYQVPIVTDVFIAKFNPDLTELIALTFFGGWHSEYAYDIAIDENNSIYLCGSTRSLDFPTTQGAFGISTADSGYVNGYISVFNNDLTNLLASSCLGEKHQSGNSIGYIQVQNNEIYAAGYLEAFEKNQEPGDIFIGKFDTRLTSLIAHTFLGNSGRDKVQAMQFDKSGNLVLTGTTESHNFPTTENAYQRDFTYLGLFATKLKPDLDILYSTFCGGLVDINIRAMYIDYDENIYISGIVDTATYAPRFPPNNFTIVFDSTLSIMLDSSDNAKIFFGHDTFLYGLNRFSGFENYYNEINNKRGTLGAYREVSNFESYIPTQYYSEREFSIIKYSKDLEKELVKTYFGPYWVNWGTPYMHLLNDGNILIVLGAITDNLPLTENSWNKEFIGGEYGLIGPFVGDLYLAILDSNLSDNITAIYASADSGGIILPSGVFEIEDSLTQSFSIIPDAGKYVKQVWIDHQPVGAITSYEFINAKEDHYIQVEFDTIPNSIHHVEFSKTEIKCFPNPFKEFVTISFYLDTKENIDISIYDISGKKIKTIYNGIKNTGTYNFKWNETEITPGIYIVNLKMNGITSSTRIMHY